jgi:hypothetical protein
MTPIVKAASSTLVGDGVPASRKRIAIGIGILSDAVQVALFPITIEGAASPGEIALDLVTAVAMVLVLGFQWRLAAAFAIELIPGISLFPSWTAMALMLPTRVEATERTDITVVEGQLTK